MNSNFPDDSLEIYNSLLKEIEQLVKDDPGNKKWQYELSKCHSRIGTIQFSKSVPTAGTNSFLNALNILEQLVKNEPDNMNWQYELARTYETLGDFLQLHDDLAYAELIYSVALDIRKRKQGEEHTEYISSLIKLVSLYMRMHKLEVAESLLKQQLAVYEKLRGIELPGYALCLDLLAGLYLEKGNSSDAQLFYLKTVSAKKKVFGENHPEYEAALNKLNNLYKTSGSLNSLYGDMKNAMQGNQSKEAEKNSNPVGENVNFAISFPSGMVAAESYILDIWLFLEEQRNMLLSRIKEESNDDIKIKSEGPVIIERGTTITARLTIENLIAEPAEKTMLWTGSLNNSSFIVRVPEDIKEGSKIGWVNFYINGLEISRLNFKVQIISKQKEDSKPINGFASGIKYKTAFASYASVDRDDVLARVQGLEKAGIDVFLDVRNLRSGDKYEDKLLEKILATDIFYLFWSTAAKKSEWVRKEWEYALTNRGIDFINPIPLEPPDIAPPPAELSQVLHFGDWTLAYKRSKSN